MNRPRSSILDLFDPLTRDAPSPDSDKENSTPPSFFGPVKLTRRLVDVGDITVQDHSIQLLLNDHEDQPDTLDENLSPTTPRPSSSPSPRTPLAELPVEYDTSPMARSKTYKRPPLPPSTHPDPEPHSHGGSAILSVINEVNSSGISFASPSPRLRVLPLPQDVNDLAEEVLPSDTSAPQIIVSSADPLRNSVATLNLESSTSTLLTDTIRPFDNAPQTPPSEDPSQLLPNLRLTLPKLSSRDSNRQSIDLHSSFELHLKSGETSFDLLNDRVSFFAPGGDAESFFGDDSFDIEIEEANMEQALDKIKAEEKAGKGEMPSPGTAPSAGDGQPNSPPSLIPETRRASSDIAPGDSARKSTPKRLSLQPTPSPKITSPGTRSAVSLDSPSAIPVFVPPRARPNPRRISVYTPRPSVRDMSAKPPLAVPALKIVKRAKRFEHDKSSSSGSSSSSAPSPVPALLGTAQTAVSTEQRSRPVSSITNSQVGRESSTIVAASTGGMARVAGQSRAAAEISALTAAPIRRTGTGPRRVPIAEGHGNIVSNSFNQKPPPAVGIIGPKRVPVVVASKICAAAPIQAKAPVASGLKPPVKYGGSSALPRPVAAGTSRLPASGSGKMKTIGTGEVKGNVGLGVRRMIFGGK